MARTLDTFPTATGQQRHPWDAWLDGQVWELVRGDDFTAKISTLRANAQLQARKRGGTVRTRSAERDGQTTLILQFRRA